MNAEGNAGGGPPTGHALDELVADRTQELGTSSAESRRNTERFAKAFQASPMPFAIQTFEENRFVDANDAFVQLTGFSRAELIGRTPLEVPFCLDCEARLLAPLREQKPVRHIEAQISTKAGEMRSALVSIEPIALEGEPHLLVMVLDISERVRLETQLRQAQKMEAIGQLAAGIAHDFNNLLTIIQGHASLQLSLYAHPPETVESLRQIALASERAAALTRQLLAFSRQQIMQPRVFDLNALIRDLTVMLRRLLGEQIELHCKLAENLPPVWADQTGLEQVLMNLTLNARDAMPKGGRIVIATSLEKIGTGDRERNREAIPGEYIALSVCDTGTGMDASTRSRIFEPFFTTKEVHKGTGMGLATVYGITKQHEGWVEVSTELGRGSEFHVYLPTTNRAPEPEEPESFIPEVADHEHTILIVEDDHAVRDLVKEVLVHHKYRVLEAENADATLEIWETHADEIELLLTDMVMPGSANGLELAAQLLAKKPALKVIYTSGYSADLFTSDVKLQEGRNYLPKPYLSSKLTAILRGALHPKG